MNPMTGEGKKSLQSSAGLPRFVGICAGPQDSGRFGSVSAHRRLHAQSPCIARRRPRPGLHAPPCAARRGRGRTSMRPRAPPGGGQGRAVTRCRASPRAASMQSATRHRAPCCFSLSDVLLLGPTGWEEAGAREEEVVRGEAGARPSRVAVEGGEFSLRTHRGGMR
jgi:hypothetical protein